MTPQKLNHPPPRTRPAQGRRAARCRDGGFSLIELLIVVAIIGIISAIAIPNLLTARRAANEASAVSSLRTIASAEVTYRATAGQGSFGDLTQLGGQNLVDSTLAQATSAGTAKSGYFYDVNVTTGEYFAAAAAASAAAGTRRFSTTQSGVIYGDAGNPTSMPSATVGVPIGN